METLEYVGQQQRLIAAVYDDTAVLLKLMKTDAQIGLQMHSLLDGVLSGMQDYSFRQDKSTPSNETLRTQATEFRESILKMEQAIGKSMSDGQTVE